MDEIKEDEGLEHYLVSGLKIFAVLFILVVFFSILFVLFFNNLGTEKIETCSDGSFYATCSLDKPYFCDEDGNLLEKASICGCPSELQTNRDSCVSVYTTGKVQRSFKYVLRGEEKEINVDLYKGFNDYLSTTSNIIDYSYDEIPFRVDFKLANINQKEQNDLLTPLVKEIQKNAENEVDDARIAISIVQNIEWGESEKKINFGSSEVGYSRKLYEVLYESQGICGEKSDLLAFLLKRLGYGVVLFYNQAENHESVGIKCPLEESFHGSGYCFVETSGPAIISDSGIEYVGGIKIESEPQILLISQGKSLPKDMYEYKDAKLMQRIRNGGLIGFFYSSYAKSLDKKYGLAESYEIG